MSEIAFVFVIGAGRGLANAGGSGGSTGAGKGITFLPKGMIFDMMDTSGIKLGIAFDWL